MRRDVGEEGALEGEGDGQGEGGGGGGDGGGWRWGWGWRGRRLGDIFEIEREKGGKIVCVAWNHHGQEDEAWRLGRWGG